VKRQDVSGVERLAVDSTGGGVGSDVNVTGINGTAPSTGGGASDGGTLRVIVATDSPSSGNPAAGATGAAVPASADYQGVNVGGTLRGATGVNPSGSIFAQQGDLTSVAGTTTATGNGVVSAGVQRVAIASDNTAFAVNATLQAGAAVIGHVITDTGSTTAVTGNVTVVQGTGTNLHAVLDAGSAIVGKVGIDQTTPGTTNAVSLSQINATTTATGNGVVGTGVQRVAIASDNTAFSVNATIAANQSVNVNQLAGTATSVNSGVKDAGTLRVVIATDQPQLTNKLLVTPDANSAVNVAQLAGTATSVNSGNKDAGTLRVVLATDQPALTNGLLVTATGNVASDGIDSGNPVKIGMLAKSADITAVSDADRVDAVGSLLGKQLVLQYATPALTWSYAAAAGGLVTTGGVTAKAAGTGAQRNYITRVQAINSHQTIGTEVVIRDGAAGTVLWRGWAQFAGGGCSAVFDPPLRGSAATLVEIAEITATASTGVLVNLQGYTAAE
jgi:hypothetical protein